MPRNSLLLALLVGSSLSVPAAQINTVFTFTGTGTLNGVPFVNAQVVASYTGDTGDRQGSGGSYLLSHNNGSVTIAGFAPVTMANSNWTTTFAENSLNLVGLITLNGNLVTLINPALGAWDMTTSIGPVAGTHMLSHLPFTTSGGTLLFTNTTDTGVTFQATVSDAQVPEPSTFVFAVSALALGLVTMRNRRHVSCSR